MASWNIHSAAVICADHSIEYKITFSERLYVLEIGTYRNAENVLVSELWQEATSWSRSDLFAWLGY